MESLNGSQQKNQKNKKGGIQDTASAGRPKMTDNNDDNEFATTPLKASFTVESNTTTDRDQKVSSGSANAAHSESVEATSGSADKVDESTLATASKLEQKLEARMDDIANLIFKAGEKIQRLGEALCRIGDKVENMPKSRSNRNVH